MNPIETILITTDLTRKARAGVELGLDMAAALGASVTLLYVVRDLDDLTPEGSDLDAATKKSYRRMHREAADRVFEGIKKRAVKRNIILDVEVKEGDPADQIIRTGFESDLIVMSAGGPGEIMRNLIGQVAQLVLRFSDTPVLLTRGESTTDD